MKHYLRAQLIAFWNHLLYKDEKVVHNFFRSLDRSSIKINKIKKLNLWKLLWKRNSFSKVILASKIAHNVNIDIALFQAESHQKLTRWLTMICDAGYEDYHSLTLKLIPKRSYHRLTLLRPRFRCSLLIREELGVFE